MNEQIPKKNLGKQLVQRLPYKPTQKMGLIFPVQ